MLLLPSYYHDVKHYDEYHTKYDLDDPKHNVIVYYSSLDYNLFTLVYQHLGFNIVVHLHDASCSHNYLFDNALRADNHLEHNNEYHTKHDLDHPKHDSSCPNNHE